MTQSPHNIHDTTFRSAMQHPEFAKSILSRHLPESIQQDIDWSSLELRMLDGSHINHDIQRETHADVIYSAHIKEKETLFLIHLEHQKKPDKLLATRLINYTSGLLLNYAKQRKTKILPTLVTLVYYQGPPSPYPHSLDWADCFQDPLLARQWLMRPILIDVKQLNDQKIMDSSPLSASIELAFKYIDERDFNPYTLPVLKTLRAAPLEIRKIAIQYILKRGNVNPAQLLDGLIQYLPDNEEMIMQLYQQNQQRYIDQGLQQGLQQGRQEGRQEGQIDTARAIGMLKHGDSTDYIKSITGLSDDMIKTLSEAIASSEV